MTPAEFLAILKDPAVYSYMKAVSWQYNGGGLAGPDVSSSLAELTDNCVKVNWIVNKLARTFPNTFNLAELEAELQAQKDSTGKVDKLKG